MATRKQMRQRRNTRRQRGGGLFDTIKEFISKILPIKREPLLTPSASGSVAINIGTNTPPSAPNVKVNKPLTPQEVSVAVGTPTSSGLSSSLQGVTGSEAAPVTGSQTNIQMTPPKPNTVMTPPAITKIYGGRRRKNKRSKTQRRRK